MTENQKRKNDDKLNSSNNKKSKTDTGIQTNQNDYCDDDDENDFLKFLSSVIKHDNENYESSDSSSDEDSSYSEDEVIKKNIDKKINSIDDLIELGKLYDPSKNIKYNIDIKKINKLIEPLTNLKNMIGLENVKKNIVNQIIYFLCEFEGNGNDMMHTVITGPPGVGKTKLGTILGDIYFNLGILKPMKKKKARYTKSKEKYPFKIVKRSDLVGKYLGHTASKTQDVIDSCDGGVMFIDEAYSLGNPEGRDSFSKECLDTLNQNLTEKKSNFLCIIAGYKDALESCFFSYNEGLSRRFTFRYEIEKYSAKELKLIFVNMIKDINWEIHDDKKVDNFFEKNYNNFKNMAGDMETLLFNCKITHSKRVFGNDDLKKKINIEDIEQGFNNFNNNRTTEDRSYLNSLYV